MGQYVESRPPRKTLQRKEMAKPPLLLTCLVNPTLEVALSQQQLDITLSTHTKRGWICLMDYNSAIYFVKIYQLAVKCHKIPFCFRCSSALDLLLTPTSVEYKQCIKINVILFLVLGCHPVRHRRSEQLLKKKCYANIAPISFRLWTFWKIMG